jgi:hypothetical protein
MGPVNTVMLQIQGIWVTLPVIDPASGFLSLQPQDLGNWYYQSSDCTGQAYMLINAFESSAPAYGIVTAIPPATAPSIYYAGTPNLINFGSYSFFGASCVAAASGSAIWLGPVQNYPVSSLGFTLPFSIQ